MNLRSIDTEAAMTRRAFAMSLTAAITAACGLGQAAAAVEGKITTDAGKPVANATVFLDAGSRRFHLETKSNAAGRYEFENLQAGQYMLWSELPGYGCIVYPNIAVESGQRVHRDFKFSNRDAGCET